MPAANQTTHLRLKSLLHRSHPLPPLNRLRRLLLPHSVTIQPVSRQSKSLAHQRRLLQPHHHCFLLHYLLRLPRHKCLVWPLLGQPCADFTFVTTLPLNPATVSLIAVSSTISNDYLLQMSRHFFKILDLHRHMKGLKLLRLGHRHHLLLT